MNLDRALEIAGDPKTIKVSTCAKCGDAPLGTIMRNHLGQYGVVIAHHAVETCPAKGRVPTVDMRT